MNIRNGLRCFEVGLPGPVDVIVPVFFDAVRPERWRQGVREARDRGYRTRTIRFGLQTFAKSVEEAVVMVAKHRADFPFTPITVSRALADWRRETLAEWTPPLPVIHP